MESTFTDQVGIGREGGYSLIEVLIAITVFAIALLGISSLQITAVKSNSNAYQLSGGANTAMETIETLIALPYNNVNLLDPNGNGTNQPDANNDGVDDNGGNFGLDDETTATADFTTTLGIYTIHWNVAVNYPLPDNKTIRVIVKWTEGGTNKSVTMDSVVTSPDFF